MTGRRSQRTYAVRAGSETWAFVPHPEVSGWWFRVHPSVLALSCGFCGVKRGQPCKGDNGYVAWVHAARRREGARAVAKLHYAFGVVMNIERGRDLTPDPESGDPSRT